MPDAATKFRNDPTALVRMHSGYAYMGYTQFLPGCCLLFADPEVAGLNDLDIRRRSEFLLDMSLLGDAITSVCRPVRINYGILANSTPVLHAHLYPRYDWEPEERRSRNVWTYPDEIWNDDAHKFDEARHGMLKMQLAEVLKRLTVSAYLGP